MPKAVLEVTFVRFLNILLPFLPESRISTSILLICMDTLFLNDYATFLRCKRGQNAIMSDLVSVPSMLAMHRFLFVQY